jgi:SAM-dependent methyltransferase
MKPHPVRLSCSMCGGAVLAGGTVSVDCVTCEAVFPLSADGQIDFRLLAPRQVQLTVEIGSAPPVVPPIELGPNPAPEVDLTALSLPPTISHRFATWLPRASRPGAVALDLGCGDTRARGLVERAGYTYVGIDYEGSHAQYLADAHSLPFEDGAFDLVVTTAVIEYLRQPYVAMQEVHRVLREDGAFCGNVGFLIPYLPVTYFHHTHMGILSTLGHAGFHVERLLMDNTWTAIESTTQMAYFPRLPRALRALLVRPYKALHGLWWRLGNRFADRPLSDVERQLRVTADVEFIARTEPQR